MRVAIVNDMPIAVEAMRRALRSTRKYKIAWIAHDGAEAVRKTFDDKPDLILMDLMMPVMDGARATHEIMKLAPCAILVVTATVSGHAPKVFEAMGYGALDAVRTPVFAGDGSLEGGADLLAKIASVSRLIDEQDDSGEAKPVLRGRCKAMLPPIIAIGASTGGPCALAEALQALPSKYEAATIVIQHVDIQFADGLVHWLDGQLAAKVRLVEEGARPQAGDILVAGTNDHLILAPNGSLRYTEEPKNYPFRPSVDTFFYSLKDRAISPGVAVLLTGMGTDGAKGLLALREAGWHTIAQDKTTSVIYGMPRAAARLGAAVEVLPIDKIGPAIIKKLAGKEE